MNGQIIMYVNILDVLTGLPSRVNENIYTSLYLENFDSYRRMQPWQR